MSLSLILQNNDSITICSDSRRSIKVNGIDYAIDDNYPKIIRKGNKLLFTCGSVDVISSLLAAITKDYTIEQIRDTAAYITGEYIQKMGAEYINNIFMDEDGLQICVLIVATIEDNEPVVYKIGSYNDFEIERVVNPDYNTIIHTGGIKSNKALDMLLNSNVDIDRIREVYEELAYEGIGGFLSIYQLDSKGIRRILLDRIKDRNTIKYYPTSATGAIIKTSGSGSRIELKNAGIQGYNSANQTHGIHYNPTATDADFLLDYNGTEFFRLQHFGNGLAMKASGNAFLYYDTITPAALLVGEWDFTDASTVVKLNNVNDTFDTADGKTVTVENGVITSIV